MEGITAVRRRDQRWLVHIAPVEMQGAREVVKFVTEIAVVLSGIQVKHKFGGPAPRSQGLPASSVWIRSNRPLF